VDDFLFQYSQPIKATTNKMIITTTTAGMTASSTALSSSLTDTPTVGLIVVLSDVVLLVTENDSVTISTIVVGTITLEVVLLITIEVVAPTWEDITEVSTVVLVVLAAAAAVGVEVAVVVAVIVIIVLVVIEALVVVVIGKAVLTDKELEESSTDEMGVVATGTEVVTC